MNDPLAELNEWLAKAIDNGGAGTEHLEFVDRGEECQLTFESWDNKGGRASWMIEAHECTDVRWVGEEGDPKWYGEHILLPPIGGPWISFSSPFDNPDLALGKVARVHRELAGSWIPLSRYFRVEMLDERFGELARGPKELISAYERVLLELGCDVAMAAYPEEKVGLDRRVSESLLLCDESYIIARSFELTRLS